MRRWLRLVAAVWIAACSPAGAAEVRVLVFSKTAGFRTTRSRAPSS